MKQFVRLCLLSLFAVALTASPSSAGPVECSGMLASGNGPLKLYKASVDSALSCVGPMIGNNVFPADLPAFSHTWLAQDKDNDAGPENGANEGVLSITGANTTAGTFTIDPTKSQCGAVDCNVFAFGLKFGPAVVFWDLGAITTTTTFNWATNKNALSNGAVYARYEEFDLQVPEPGMMLLFATGAAAGLRRRFSAR